MGFAGRRTFLWKMPFFGDLQTLPAAVSWWGQAVAMLGKWFLCLRLQKPRSTTRTHKTSHHFLDQCVEFVCCWMLKELLNVNVEAQRSHNHSSADCLRLDRSSFSSGAVRWISRYSKLFAPHQITHPVEIRWNQQFYQNHQKLLKLIIIRRGCAPEDEDMLLVSPLLILLNHNQRQLLLLEIEFSVNSFVAIMIMLNLEI